MAVLVSLLRGINVAGRRMLKMSELAKLYSSLGFEDVRTYLQSGNVVFSNEEREVPSIGKLIETELKTRLNVDTRVLVRTPRELEKIMARNPFVEKERSRLHVTFLYSKPAHIPLERLNTVRAKGEEFAISGREVFLFLPRGSGMTKLSNSFFEKTLGVPATTRNWNTVTALSRMASQHG